MNKLQLSDHSLESKMITDIPVYNWNIWAFGSANGFSSNRETDLNKYTIERFNPQIEIIRNIFTYNNNAIVCLQEVTTEYMKKLLIELTKKRLSINYQYSKTGEERFGQAVLYNTNIYKFIYKSSAFVYVNDKTQNNRVLKVNLEEKTGKQREIAIINVHLKSYKLDDRLNMVPPLIDSVIKYAEHVNKTINPQIIIICGDFNYDLNYYKNPNVKVYPVGFSYSFTTKQTKKITDGFIVDIKGKSDVPQSRGIR